MLIHLIHLICSLSGTIFLCCLYINIISNSSQQSYFVASQVLSMLLMQENILHRFCL
jgi:uncharacterized membrane protein